MSLATSSGAIGQDTMANSVPVVIASDQSAISVEQGALQAGTDIVTVEGAITTVTLYNLTLTSADTEYSQILPATCRRLSFKCREEATMRWAMETGKVATPTEPYVTLPGGAVFDSGAVLLTGETLYLASSVSGVVAEIDAWS